MNYLNRLVDEQIEFYLDTFGAVLIRGPKWCGKTTSAEIHAKSVIKMQDKNKSKSYIDAANTNVSLILDGEYPRLIDEWQVAPVLWDAIRVLVDEKSTSGMFLLTGSRIPVEGTTLHSGAGRIGVLNMYTMSSYEAGDSNGSISLEKMFNKKEIIDGKLSNKSLKDIAYFICRGGWPDNIGLEYKKCAIKLKSYLELIYESDDMSLNRYAKNIDVAKEIITSYSRNISTNSSMRTIYEDVIKNDISISETQFYDYINAFKNNYLIEEIKAWNPSIRSKTAIRSTPKKELVDPSIAALYLGITPDNFVEDFNTFGLLFESFCIRDLKVYVQSLGGTLLYYRDREGLECDVVIRLDNGNYGLVEIKLSSNGIDEATTHLNQLEELIEKANLKKPSFKMILTGGDLAYTKENNVYVVPICCLKN